MKNQKKTQPADYLFLLSALLMLAGIILTNETDFPWAKFVFCAGGAGYIVYRIKTAYRGDDFRLKRLNRLYGFCGLLVIMTGYLMFIDNNAFIVLMLLLALLELYLSFRSENYRKNSDKN